MIFNFLLLQERCGCKSSKLKYARAGKLVAVKEEREPGLRLVHLAGINEPLPIKLIDANYFFQKQSSEGDCEQI